MSPGLTSAAIPPETLAAKAIPPEALVANRPAAARAKAERHGSKDLPSDAPRGRRTARGTR
jgi:hypothetical protein